MGDHIADVARKDGMTGALSRLRNEAGLTLVEVMIAMTILAVILAVSAQAMAGFLVAMDLHREQTVAIQSCRSVLGGIREQRPEFRNEFPVALAGWIFEQNENGWAPYLLVEETFGRLEDHAMVVSVTNLEGDPAGVGDNPIVVYVTTTWIGIHGRPMRAVVSTMLSDR